jgi:hypothetical protein
VQSLFYKENKKSFAIHEGSDILLLASGNQREKFQISLPVV